MSTNSSLAEICEVAIDTVKDVYNHEFGIPRIRSSGQLTALELEYLDRARARTRTPKMDIKITDLTGRLQAQADISAKLSAILAKQRQFVNRLHAHIIAREMKQEALHEDNRRTTKQIVSTTRQLRDSQRERFSKEQYKEYREELEDLRQAREITSVLKDLIPALIASSGQNWADDERLLEIIEHCGEQPKVPTNDETI
ncbi:hypothetical protein TRVA0_053S00848 [Trichomonascus vanleenenianus]|uniref:uncharacterized protein n=1 Tax=Trichomonascus vanleenenianus TaxID=2268995 RepID=UPI003ECB5F47